MGGRRHRDTIPVLNPSDGQQFETIARSGQEDVDRAVGARAAFGRVGQMAPAARSRLLMRIAFALLDRQEELAQLESADTGKPIKQARADAAAVARYFEFYAGAVDKLHGQTIPYNPGFTVLTVREAHGVTGHIVPWNYPLQIFGRSVGAALAAGNACVVKPAEDACLSLLKLAEIAAEAGLPAGALNIVTGYGHEAGAALSAHPGIDHISFTGSPQTGKMVAHAAADNHVPVTLELGGKSPQIVFDDADLDAAMPVLLAAIIQNAGQTCSAGSRVLIQRGVYETVLKRLSEAFAATVTGPAAQDLDVGPLISARQHDRVRGFVAEAEAEEPEGGGARQAQGRRVRVRLLPGAGAVPRRAAEQPPGAGGSVWPGAGRHGFRHRRGSGRAGQRHALRPGRRRLDARRRPPAAPGPPAARRPGLRQQLRRGRWGGTAVRRFAPVGLWPREGVRGAVWLHDRRRLRSSTDALAWFCSKAEAAPGARPRFLFHDDSSTAICWTTPRLDTAGLSITG